jgi:anti-anti-sigma factor
MNVFISWSGEISKLTATALHAWLPNILQSVEPWMSTHDLIAGAQWSTDLHARLAEAEFGILCLTRDNQSSSWLAYETGCMVIRLPAGRVVPYCLDLRPSEINSPLSHLQGVSFDQEGTRKLVHAVNAALPGPLPLARLDALFAKWWPDLLAAFGPQVRVEMAEQIAIATFCSRKFIEEAEVVRLQLRQAVELGQGNVVVDITNVDYMSSSIWGAVLSTFRRCYKSGGAAALVGRDEALLDFLSVTKLDKVLPHFSSLPEAIAHIRNRPDSEVRE